MAFLTPIFLVLGLLTVPILILYMLRLRRRDMPVSSTMLWAKLTRDREANAPWQRLRRNLLLLLQLFILAALVLALARPFLPVPSVVSGSVVVLLDGSASMLASDVAPDRFEVARERVNDFIGDLGRNDQMTLILVGRTPAVLASATNDKSQLRRVLNEAQASPETADWPAAIALASGAAQGFQEARIAIITDGGLPEGLPPLPAETVYLPVGISGENLAISALATRDTRQAPELFAGVTNYGQMERQALISIDLDGILAFSSRINVPAGGTTNLTWNLPEDVSIVTARLTENDEDFLRLDDEAWAVHESGVSNRALIVGEGNRFLETVFNVLPGMEAFRANSETEVTGVGAEDFDLFIFDGVVLPDPIPAAAMLIIDPQPGLLEQGTSVDSVFGVTGVFSNTQVIRVADNPLSKYLDWSNIHVRQAKEIDAPWAQPVVTAEGGPLLLTGEKNGHRIGILTFRLQESDLPLQIAFPVLIANITSWLSPGRAFDASRTLGPGDPLGITPNPDTDVVRVIGPGEEIWSEPVGEEAIVFAQTNMLGVYDVSLRNASGDQAAGSFAVNLFAESESAIQPAETIRLGLTTVETANEEDVGQRELWPWLAGLALIVLLVEWWVFHRGAFMPQWPDRQTILGRFGRG